MPNRTNHAAVKAEFWRECMVEWHHLTMKFTAEGSAFRTAMEASMLHVGNKTMGMGQQRGHCRGILSRGCSHLRCWWSVRGYIL